MKKKEGKEEEQQKEDDLQKEMCINSDIVTTNTGRSESNLSDMSSWAGTAGKFFVIICLDLPSNLTWFF